MGKSLLVAGIMLVIGLTAFRAEPAGAPAEPAAGAGTLAPAPGPEPDISCAPGPGPDPISAPSPCPGSGPVTTAQAPPPPPEPVPYDGPVEHIFFHPLVLYTELAFDGDFLSQGYDDWFVTVPEFHRIVTALYTNGYILVDFDDLFETGTMTRRELKLPPGKKPLIISIDDLNYYDYMRDNGNAHKLILDARGQVATYSVDPAGSEVISYTNEIVPVLDRFVAEHPDFSLSGAKGVIALTGYEGILGYRTNDPAAPGYEAERSEAIRVAGRLKELGWSFAAHGWGHQDAGKITRQHLARDTARWKAEVEPLVGPTPVYIYPFGSAVQPGDPKFDYLIGEGFRILCSVGPDPYLHVTDRYAMMDRRHIDGMAFRTMRESLLPLFDAALIIDRESRP